MRGPVLWNKFHLTQRWQQPYEKLINFFNRDYANYSKGKLGNICGKVIIVVKRLTNKSRIVCFDAFGKESQQILNRI